MEKHLHSAGKNTSDVDIPERKVFFPWGPLKVGTIFTIIAFLITSVYASLDRLLIQPEVDKRKEAETQLIMRDAQINNLTKNIEAIDSKLRDVEKGIKQPILISPSHDEAIITDNIEFKWETPEAFPYNLDIEIRGGARAVPYKYHVLHPEERIAHIPKRYLGTGDFFWRIIPEFFRSDAPAHESTQGGGFGHFTIYDSISQRINSTGQLTVGLTETFEGPFNYPSENGKLTGIDIDLIYWLSKPLSEIASCIIAGEC